jgi:hypothetical protein
MYDSPVEPMAITSTIAALPITTAKVVRDAFTFSAAIDFRAKRKLSAQGIMDSIMRSRKLMVN